MNPTKEWLDRYMEVKDLLVSRTDYTELFKSKEANGKNLFIIDMGKVNFPTGNILVRDPLVDLDKDEEPYFQKVPTGIYSIETIIVELDEDYYRYVATRVKFTDEDALIYRAALSGHENLDNVDENSYFGFPVDAGLATIVDVETRDAFAELESKFMIENPDGNLYDDYFSDEFEKSYKENPKYQRPDGDWINYKLEGTELSIPMIQTGFGDGFYPVYFGYDKDENIVDVVIEYIDLEEDI